MEVCGKTPPFVKSIYWAHMPHKHLTLLLSLACFGPTAAAQDPTPQRLAQQAMANGRRLAAEATEYTADFHYTWRFYSKSGKLERETITSGETYQSSFRNVDIELTKNGKPVKNKNIQKAREAAGRELQADYDQRMKRIREGKGKASASADGPEYGTHLGNVRMDYYSVLREFDLHNLRHETRQGRDTFAMDFEPRGEYRPLRKDLAHLPGIRGTVWIDAGDRVVVEWRAAIAKGPKAGTVFYEQESERLPDGVWIGRRSRINLAADPALLGGQRVEWISETSNRKRFGVQTEESLKDPR